jgi:hypothetical protein
LVGIVIADVRVRVVSGGQRAEGDKGTFVCVWDIVLMAGVNFGFGKD